MVELFDSRRASRIQCLERNKYDAPRLEATSPGRQNRFEPVGWHMNEAVARQHAGERVDGDSFEERVILYEFERRKSPTCTLQHSVGRVGPDDLETPRGQVMALVSRAATDVHHWAERVEVL